MKIKEVMNQTRLPENTIRFYESKGLIVPETQRRNGRTYHEFSQENVRELQHIISLRRANFTIEEIRRMQRSPETLPQVVSAYRRRVQQDAQELSLLSGAAQLEEAENWHALSERVDEALHHIANYEPKLNFAQFEEEEHAASTGLPAERVPFFTKNTVIVLLCILCAALAGTTLYLFSQMLHTVPASAGTTQGWEYYEDTQGLMRRNSETAEPELVYKKPAMGGSIQYIIEEDKLYLRDGQNLYSMNADGSGKYKFHPAVFSSYLDVGSGDYSSRGIFQLYGESLYTVEAAGGAFSGSSCIVRVSVRDGTAQRVHIEWPEEWATWSGYIWEDQMYLIGYTQKEVTLENGEVMTVGDQTEVQVYDLGTEKLVREAAFDYAAYALCFQDGTAYLSSLDNGSDLMQQEVPGCTHLIRLDLSTLEDTDIHDGAFQAIRFFDKYYLYIADPVAEYFDGNEYPSWNGGKVYLENIETSQRVELDSEANHFSFLNEGVLFREPNSGELKFVPYP